MSDKPDSKAKVKKPSPKSKYKPEYCDALRKHMGENGSFKTFCVTIGVGLQTTKDWVKAHPEFAQAKEDAFLVREKNIEKLAWDVASGQQRGNAQLIKLLLVNHCGYKNLKEEEEEKNKKIEIKLAVDPTRSDDRDPKISVGDKNDPKNKDGDIH